MIRTAKSLLILVVMFTIPALADTLLDGSFEPSSGIPTVSSSDSCGGYANAVCYGVGQDIGHWAIVGLSDPSAPSVMLMSTNYRESNNATNAPLLFNVENGVQAIDLTGAGNQIAGMDGIKQSLTLNPGSYDLSFWVGRQDASAPGYLGTAATDPASVSLWIGQNGSNATQAGVFDNFTGGNDNVNWKQFHYEFTASGYTTIAFLNNTALGNNYAGLDNIALTQTPEPVSLWLLGSGLIGLAGLKLRKAR